MEVRTRSGAHEQQVMVTEIVTAMESQGDVKLQRVGATDQREGAESLPREKEHLQSAHLLSPHHPVGLLLPPLSDTHD